MLPRSKKEKTGRKELNSKDKKKKCGTPTKKSGEKKNAKQQVRKKKKKCSTQGPRMKKEKIRKKELRRRHEKKDKVHCSLYKFYVFLCRF